MLKSKFTIFLFNQDVIKIYLEIVKKTGENNVTHSGFCFLVS